MHLWTGARRGGERSAEPEPSKPRKQQMAGRMDGTMSLKCTWLWSLKVLSIGGFHYVFRGPQRWLSRSEHLPYNHEDLSLSPSRHIERWAVGVHVPESSVPLEADGRRVAGAS